MSAIDAPQKPLSFWTKLAFGAGDLGPAMTANVLVFFLLFFFTQVAGLPPGLAGSILAVGKISDALNDPVIGWLSDRTRTRWGRRLPWLLAGALPFGALFALQWWVPPGWGDWALFAYYAVIGVLFNLAYTAVNLPYTALTPELTTDYNERTSLNSFRFAFSLGGSIVSLLLAQQIFQALPENPLGQYLLLGGTIALLATLPTFWCALALRERGVRAVLARSRRRWLGGILLGIALLLFIVGAVGVWQGQGLVLALAIVFGVLLGAFGLTLLNIAPESGAEEVPLSPQTLPLGQQIRIAFANRAFVFVVGIYLFSWLAVQLTASILPFFVSNWMQLGAETFAQVALCVQGTALVLLFVWSAIARRTGKKATFAAGVVLWLVAQVGLIAVQPGQEGWLYGLAALAGTGVSVAYLIPWSMVPDVIDLDELNTGQRREGIYYGFMVLLQKIGLAAGLFIVGQGLQWAGFIESIPGEPLPVQPESALFAIRLVVAPLPAFFLVASLVLVYFYPITRAAHQQILLQLAQRQETL